MTATPSSIKSRVEDLAMLHGLQVRALESGIQEAVHVWTRFVRTLPETMKNPTVFTQLLADNHEIVYSLIEAAGLSIGNENKVLRDEIDELQLAMSAAVSANIRMLSGLHDYHRTLAYQVDCGGFDAGDDDESGDDENMCMPMWRLTIVLKGSAEDPATYERFTTVVSHSTLAQLFPKAELVTVDPDPWYDGPDVDDVVNGFGSSAAVDTDELPL